MLILLIAAGAVVLVVVLARGSAEKTKFGVNLAMPVCPVCGEALPALRKPANARQGLWGGCTCAKCGAELDKWCRPIGENGGRA